MGVEAQDVHVRLARQLEIRGEQLVAGPIEEKFAEVIGAAHEHWPPADGERPAFRPGLQPNVTNAEGLAETGAPALVGRDLELCPVEGRLAVRPWIPELGIRQGELDD